MNQASAIHDPVLLVDDDESGRVTLAAILDSGGYPVRQATEGDSALELLRDGPLGAIVLGAGLSDVFARIREREEAREVPVLFVSGDAVDEDHVLRAFEGGAWDFIRRPFGAREFLARLAAALRQRALLKEMKRLGATDELTGLPNRRAFYEALERERRRAEREGSDLSIVAIDVDRFKHVNDTYGHAAGDRALRAIARVLREQTRATDVAGRVGGEEFEVLLPSTSKSGAADFAEKVRRGIAAIALDLPDGRSLSVTASFGIAAARGKHLLGEEDAVALLAAADAALYRAKRSGRDRVEISVSL